VVSPLFSFFYSTDELVKWRAVTAMGRVVAMLADKDMESARIVMRRLMWNLNDESGGIGWGSPEAMGEIMACHAGLAEEYACILISYIMEDGNFLEHEALQRGAVWGIGRLAHARPALVIHSTHHLIPFLKSSDTTLRGFSVWASGALDPGQTEPFIRKLTEDPAKVRFYTDWLLIESTVGQLAADTLARWGRRRMNVGAV
jgi:hypothetical protein